MKYIGRAAALLLTAAMLCTGSGCKEKEPPVYEEIVTQFMDAVKDENEKRMLRALGDDVYFDSVRKIYNADPDFYRAMGYEDAEQYAEESFALWFKELTHHMKKFNYSVDLAQPLDASGLSQLKASLPPAQCEAKPEEAYDISLFCETKDEDSTALLGMVEDFYAVRDGEEWYVVLPSLTLIDKPHLRPAYNFLMAVKQNDLTLLTQDESLALFMTCYEESVEKIIMDLIDAGIYDDWRQAMYYLEVDTAQELALQMIEESLYESSESGGDFEFTFGEAVLLEEEELAERLEESDFGYIEMIPEVEEAYEIEVITGALTSGDIPEHMIVGYVDNTWQLLWNE